MSTTSRPSQRDARIDIFRGLALIVIFIDHVPDNPIASVTLRNFGFSDAAEIFVFLAGYSAVLAYGRTLDERPREGVARVLARVRDIYTWHLAVLAAGTALLAWAAIAFADQKYVANIGVDALVADPVRAIPDAALLMLQPNLFNILPLYVALLAMFPVVYALLRWNLGVGLALSAAVWLGAGWSGLNMPNDSGGGWFLNPFGWQFLLALGAAAAMITRNGRLPKSPLLLAFAVAVLAVGVLHAAPWTAIPGLEHLRPIPWGALGDIDKTGLDALRLAHVISLAYATLALTSPQADWLRSPTAEAVARMGRHSLEIFALGILLSLAGWIVLSEAGDGPLLILAVNAIGIIALGHTSWLLSRRKQARASTHVAARPGPQSPPPLRYPLSSAR